MNHEEIRFRLLYALYKKYYQGDIKCWQHIDNIIEEDRKLKKAERNYVLGDAVYLADKYLIETNSLQQDEKNVVRDRIVYPAELRITASGIEEIERIIDRAVSEKVEELKSKMEAPRNFGMINVQTDDVHRLIKPEVDLIVQERARSIKIRRARRKTSP
jgi:hypothetical protein